MPKRKKIYILLHNIFHFHMKMVPARWVDITRTTNSSVKQWTPQNTYFLTKNRPFSVHHYCDMRTNGLNTATVIARDDDKREKSQRHEKKRDEKHIHPLLFNYDRTWDSIAICINAAHTNNSYINTNVSRSDSQQMGTKPRKKTHILTYSEWPKIFSMYHLI